MGNVINAATLLNAVPTIDQRAMTLTLNIGTARTRSRDKAAEELVKSTLGDEGQTVSKRIFQNPASPFKRRDKLVTEIRQFVDKKTLPHTQDGKKIFPNTLYMDISQQLADYESQLQQIDFHIENNYVAIVKQDITQRNMALAAQGKSQIACLDDYPTLDHVRGLMYFRYYFEPINTSADFRYNQTLTQADRDRLDGIVKEIEDNVSTQVFMRMLEPVKALFDKLSEYNGEKGQRFSDSFIKNLNQLAVDLPPLNINSDPAVQAMIDEIQTAIRPYALNPDALREDELARTNAKQKMAALMSKLDGYL